MALFSGRLILSPHSAGLSTGWPTLRLLPFLYSDRERLLSHAMGEHDRRSIVWDYIGIYEAGAVWETRPPKPAFDGHPVVDVIDGARNALDRLLSKQISDFRFRISGVSPQWTHFRPNRFSED